jgi:hypothetical protein
MLPDVHLKLNLELPRQTPAFKRKKTLFTSKLDLNLVKKLAKFYSWNIELYGVETWTLRKLNQIYLVSFETWCWRRMGKIS